MGDDARNDYLFFLSDDIAILRNFELNHAAKLIVGLQGEILEFIPSPLLKKIHIFTNLVSEQAALDLLVLFIADHDVQHRFYLVGLADNLRFDGTGNFTRKHLLDLLYGEEADVRDAVAADFVF